jgi:hypothetical protein
MVERHDKMEKFANGLKLKIGLTLADVDAATSSIGGRCLCAFYLKR